MDCFCILLCILCLYVFVSFFPQLISLTPLFPLLLTNHPFQQKNTQFAKSALMHVMDALVNHGCLVVDLSSESDADTDPGNDTKSATKVAAAALAASEEVARNVVQIATYAPTLRRSPPLPPPAPPRRCSSSKHLWQ